MVSRSFFHPMYIRVTVTEAQPGFIKFHITAHEMSYPMDCTHGTWLGYSTSAHSASLHTRDISIDVSPTPTPPTPWVYDTDVVSFPVSTWTRRWNGFRRDTHWFSPWLLLTLRGHLYTWLSLWRRTWCWVSDQSPAQCICHHPPKSVTQADESYHYISVRVEDSHIHSSLEAQGFSSSARCFHEQDQCTAILERYPGSQGTCHWHPAKAGSHAVETPWKQEHSQWWGSPILTLKKMEENPLFLTKRVSLKLT